MDGHMTNKMAPATVEPAKLRNFFQTNPTRKHATMLDDTNTPAPNWSVISYIQQWEPTVKRSGMENKVIRGRTWSRSSIIGWKQIQRSTQRDVPTKYKYT